MAKITVAVDTAAEPKQVMDALLDFTDRRPDVWPGLSRDLYEVYSVGEFGQGHSSFLEESVEVDDNLMRRGLR